MDPWKFWFFSNEVPGGSAEQGRVRERRFPAMGMAGGEGFVGEKREETEAHLMVVLDGVEVIGAGLSTAAGGRWWN